MKAVILAGGYSKRLWPITTEIPKAFLEFDGRPVIDHIMARVDEIADVEEVFVSTNKKFEYFFVYWMGQRQYRTPVHLVVEDTASDTRKLGALGALDFVMEQHGINEEVLLIAGDNLFEFDLESFVRRFKANGITTVAVKDIRSEKRVKRLGVVTLGDDDSVTRFVEKPIDTDSTVVCAGIYAFPADFRTTLRSYLGQGNNPDSTGYLFEWMLSEGRPIKAWTFTDPWFDVGTHQSLNEAKKYYRDLKGTILVTGGVGYLGHHVTEMLYEMGFNVKVLDLLLYEFSPDPKYEFILGDVRSHADLRRALEGVDGIVHLAGLSNDPSVDLSPDKGMDINYVSTRVLVDAAREMGVQRIVFASTCSVYGAVSKERVNEDDKPNPLTLYAHTKLASEYLLRGAADEQLDTCILRFGTLFGHSRHMRFDLVANIIAVEAVVDREIKLFGGSQERPMLHVKDAARAICESMSALTPFEGQVLNVGSSDQNYSIRDLTYEIRDNIFPGVPVKEIPENVDERSYSVDFSRISDSMGYRTTVGIVEGVGEIAEHLRSQDYGDPRDDRYFRVTYLRNRRTRV